MGFLFIIFVLKLNGMHVPWWIFIATFIMVLWNNTVNLQLKVPPKE